MADDVWNFSPGPAILPRAVLEGAGDAVHEIGGSGMSILEISHRSRWFDEVIDEAEQGIRELLAVPDGYQVLFLQGGASLQFSMVPGNLRRNDAGPPSYVVSGSWGSKALAEARAAGDVRVAWDGAGTGYDRVPAPSDVALEVDPSYVHMTSNETIEGVQWPADRTPNAPAQAPLVCDMSSDLLSRPADIGRYGLVYAGAQKNAGPAGVTIVLLRDELLDAIPEGNPAMLDYRTHVRSGSRYNTPPVFAIYVVSLVTRWLRTEVGGLGVMAARNEEKAQLLYEAIDGSEGFYRGHAQPDSRSRMNITFHLPDEDLGSAFLDEAGRAGLLELKGHRSVGGLRASIYNAMPVEGVRALRDFMETFRRDHAGSHPSRTATTSG
ncbi:MAG: 3-phosphoserine/phosphohydroxythreonine transaminase [Actinomycetota bacterium]